MHTDVHVFRWLTFTGYQSFKRKDGRIVNQVSIKAAVIVLNIYECHSSKCCTCHELHWKEHTNVVPEWALPFLVHSRHRWTRTQVNSSDMVHQGADLYRRTALFEAADRTQITQAVGIGLVPSILVPVRPPFHCLAQGRESDQRPATSIGPQHYSGHSKRSAALPWSFLTSDYKMAAPLLDRSGSILLF